LKVGFVSVAPVHASVGGLVDEELAWLAVVLGQSTQICVMTVEKAHTGEHYDDDHVDAEKHMTDFVLSGPFLIEILANGGLRVCHIPLQILRLLLFSLVLIKPR
jgi:hypothetical protein